MYSEQVFPDLNVSWDTYIDNRGHAGEENSGCFRCHDDEHILKDNGEKVIRMECDLCHVEIISEEKDIEKIKKLYKFTLNGDM